MLKTMFSSLAFILFFHAALPAQPCYLIKDIRTGTFGSNFSYLTSPVEVNNRLFFSGGECHQSAEIYAINIEEDSIYLPRNAQEDAISWCSAGNNSGPYQLTVVGNQLFYSFTDYNFGWELWTTDGTFEGTHITKDIYPGNPSGSPQELTAFDDELWFSAENAQNGRELWHSDGTPEGTQLLLDINPGTEGAAPKHLNVSNNHLFFITQTPSHGHQLWQTDGTDVGTEAVLQLDTLGDTEAIPVYMQNIEDKLFLVMRNDSTLTADVYQINTTSFHTTLLHSYVSIFNSPYYYPSHFVKTGDNTFFAAITTDYGTELWKTDGSSEGTQMVVDLNTNEEGSESSYPSHLTNYNDTLFFSTHIDGITKLYKSDGSENGTVVVESIDGFDYTGINQIHVLNEKLYFITSSKNEIWRLQDTYTEPVTTISDYDLNSISGIMNVGNDLYITARKSYSYGIWKWSEDNEIMLLKGIYPKQISSGTVKPALMKESLFFWPTDNNNERQMWSSRGQESNTYPITNLAETSLGTNRPPLVIKDSLLIFSSFTWEAGNEPWQTNGSSNAENMIIDLNPGTSGSISSFGSTDGEYVYFTSGGGVPTALYRTDGSAAGTFPLKFGINNFKFLFKFDGYTFGKVHYQGQTWLLKTNGTIPGTELLTQITSIQVSTSTPNVVIFKNWIYLLKKNTGGSWGLWRTDGSSTNIEILVQLNESAAGVGNPHSLLVAGERLFLKANDGIHGDEWWISDGTSEGTSMIIDLDPENSEFNSYTHSPLIFNDKLFFIRRDSIYGTEIWTSDGTAEGTHIFKDLILGFKSANPNLYKSIQVDSLLFFSAYTEAFGRELWQTDGTPEGTIMVQDLCPGPCSSSPENLYPYTQGRFVFSAYTPEHGIEFWLYDPLNITNAIPRKDISDIKVLVYPNPTNNMIMVEAFGIKQIEVFDLHGKAVLKKNYPINKNIAEIHLQHFPKGIYFVRIATKNGVKTVKIIKQ